LRRSLFILVVLCALALTVHAAPGEEYEPDWREFRIPPFEVIAERDNGDLRAFLGDLYQFRYLLSSLLPPDEPQAQWPIRIWVLSKGQGVAVRTDDMLPLLVDRYVAVLGPKPQLDASLKTALARTIINDSLRPIPEWMDDGLLKILGGAVIERQVIRVGAAPPGSARTLGWARANWLLTSKQSIPALRVLIGNLEKGLDERVALRNSYQTQFAQLDAEAKRLMDAAAPMATVELSGLANNPNKDFRDWYVPLGFSQLAVVTAAALQSDAAAAQAIAAARPAHDQMDHRARAELRALDAYIGLRTGDREGANAILNDLASTGNTASAWVYLEAAKIASGPAEKKRLTKIALEKQPSWHDAYRFQATLEEDAATRAKTLLEAAKHSPRSQKAWENAAASLVSAREFALADTALDGAARAARTAEERQRLQDARWNLREERARKEEEDHQNRLAAERKEMEELKGKTMARIEEALARANRANASPEVPPAEVVDYADLDDPETTEGELARVVCRSNNELLLEIRTLGGSARLLVKDPSKITSESGTAWEFHCGAQPQPQTVRATYLPKVNNTTGTIGEVLSLDAQ
jgi:hypothetical protein